MGGAGDLDVISNRIDFTAKFSTRDFSVADYYEDLPIVGQWGWSARLRGRPRREVKIYALNFGGHVVWLEKPVYAKQLEPLYQKFRSTNFNKDMFLHELPSSPIEAPVFWQAVQDLNIKVIAAVRQYGHSAVDSLISAGVPSIDVLSKCLESDIDADLFRSMNPIDAVSAQA